jgi:hypothetical protein
MTILKENQFKWTEQKMTPQQKSGVSSIRIKQKPDQKVRMIKRLRDFADLCELPQVAKHLPKTLQVANDPVRYRVFAPDGQKSVFNDLRSRLDVWNTTDVFKQFVERHNALLDILKKCGEFKSDLLEKDYGIRKYEKPNPRENPVLKDIFD